MHGVKLGQKFVFNEDIHLSCSVLNKPHSLLLRCGIEFIQKKSNFITGFTKNLVTVFEKFSTYLKWRP